MVDGASAGRAACMSVDEARRFFDGVEAREFDSLRPGRTVLRRQASQIALRLTSAGVACKRIFVVKSLVDGTGGLRVNSTTAPGARPGAPVKLSWDYHVAIAADVRGDAGRPHGDDRRSGGRSREADLPRSMAAMHADAAGEPGGRRGSARQPWPVACSNRVRMSRYPSIAPLRAAGGAGASQPCSRVRSSRRRSLPVTVFGISSRNSTCRGYL